MSYRVDTRCADLEFDRLEAGFTSYDYTNFSRVLLMVFARVEGDVHVETGRLKASGRADVERSTPETWAGEISFGGGNVRWAASEHFGYSPKHGGYPSHAYFRKVGWQPLPRFAAPGAPVPWNVGPISNTESSQGVPIEDDMLGPASSFISRGRNTPHPEGPLR
jgi:hypothetical protein